MSTFSTALINVKQPTKRATRWQGLSLRKPSEIVEMKFNDDDILLDCGILAKGQSMALLGPSGVGKSRLQLQLGISLITGRDFLGLKVNCTRQRVLIIQTENLNRRLQADLAKMKTGLQPEEWKLVDEYLVIHTIEKSGDDTLQLKDLDNANALACLIKEVKADIVAFDPLAAFAKGNLNTDDGMLATHNEMRKIVNLGNPAAAMIPVHHTLTGAAGAKKAVGLDRASYGRGSKALHGRVRGAINIAAADPDDPGRIVFACGKNSNGREFQAVGARLNPNTHFYEVDPDFDVEAWLETGGKTRLGPEDVAEYVRHMPRKKKDLVRDIMDDVGCGKSTAYNAVHMAITKTITINETKELTIITPAD